MNIVTNMKENPDGGCRTWGCFHLQELGLHQPKPFPDWYSIAVP
jgi:hypothetical protein